MPDSMQVNQVLNQIRAIRQEATTRVDSFREPAAAPAPEFSALLQSSVDGVNQTQMQAGKLAEAFERGDKNVNVTEVMVALQKADVSFQAMVEVRNKLVEAYQEVMRMPV